MRPKKILYQSLPTLHPVLQRLGESLEQARRRVRRIRVVFIDERSSYLMWDTEESRFYLEIDRKLRGEERRWAILHEMAHWVCEFYFGSSHHNGRWCEIITLLGCPEEAEKFRGTPALPEPRIAARNSP